MTTLNVFQDGNQFYNSATGKVVFETDVVRHDFDMDGAAIAKKLCVQHFRLEDVAIYFPSSFEEANRLNS